MTDKLDRSLIVDLVAPDGRRIPVRAMFIYRADDPWAVIISFRAGARGWVDWSIGRELLAEGIADGAGEADVQIEPDPDDSRRTQMLVRSPSGAALFSFDTSELQDLLALTLHLVPFGREHEHVDLDAEIRTLVTAAGDDW